MRRRARTFAALIAAVLVALLLSTGSASASYHLNKIRAVFEGPSTSAGFVELQMYADGQNLIGGATHPLTIYSSNGSVAFTYSPVVGVPTGLNQRTILFRDFASSSQADFFVTGLGTALQNTASGGAACWDVVDCVSWGAYMGSTPSPTGTSIQGGLSSTQVSVRTIARGCPTLLDEPDDTNDSNSDFGFAVGFPVRTNSVAPTETACPPAPIPTTPAPTAKKKCKKHKKKTAAQSAKKKCKKKHHHAAGEQ
jgi:hypothetical protein